MKQVVVFGTGKMAEMVYLYLTKDSDHEVAAFTVDGAHLTTRELYGRKVVPFEEVASLYPPDRFGMFVAIGYTKLNKPRARKFAEAKAKGYRCISYVHSRVMSLDTVKTGENCFILENQVIQPNVRFGDDVVVWSGNHFGHDVVVGDHSWIASHVVLSGNVSVGRYCFLGINAAVRDGVEIADETLIGAGAVILRSTKPKDVYIGEQTRKFRLDSEQFMRMTDISGRGGTPSGEGS